MEGQPSLTIEGNPLLMRKTFKEIPYLLHNKNHLLYNEIPCYRKNPIFTIKEIPYYRRKCLPNKNNKFMEAPYHRKKPLTDEYISKGSPFL